MAEVKQEQVDVEIGANDFAPSSTESKGNTLSFKNISYEVNTSKNETKTLIHPVSGTIRPTEMMCIMGQSGAGKSTILDILSARVKSSNQLKGSVLVNGQPIGKSYKRISGYVMQDDALYPMLTVRETFSYAASLRISNLSNSDRSKIVDETIAALKLGSCQNTIVGDEINRGLSGGEKRRVSIGVDTIHQPSIIFLDEPTSGLDSATALSIIQNLKEICVSGRTVILTIHQPSMKIFNSFTTAMFLAKGHVIYHGQTSKLADFIVDTSLAEEIPRFTNLPEFFLEVIEGYVDADDVKTLVHKASSHNLLIDAVAAQEAREELDHPEYANGFFKETLILTKRTAMNFLRTKELFFARFGLSIFMGVVMGSLFLNPAPDTMDGIREISSYLIYVIAFYLFTSMEAMPIFLNERTIFTRESSRGAYRTSSYVISGTLIFFPVTFFLAIMFTTVSWFMVDLPSDANIFFFQVLAILSTAFLGNCFATMISGIVPDALAGNAMGTAMLANFFLFAGFFIPRSEIPPWWIWLHWISPFKWSYEALTLNVYKKIDTLAAQVELERLSLTNTNKWLSILAIFGFAIFYRTMFFILLKFKHSGMRK